MHITPIKSNNKLGPSKPKESRFSNTPLTNYLIPYKNNPRSHQCHINRSMYLEWLTNQDIYFMNMAEVNPYLWSNKSHWCIHGCNIQSPVTELVSQSDICLCIRSNRLRTLTLLNYYDQFDLWPRSETRVWISLGISNAQCRSWKFQTPHTFYNCHFGHFEQVYSGRGLLNVVYEQQYTSNVSYLGK